MADLKNKGLCFAQIAEGNKEAFDVFFGHYYPKLIQFAHIYVNCPQQAEDIVADVLTNFLLHRKRVFVLEHFEAYLYSSIKNKALSSIKKQGKMELYPQEVADQRPMTMEAANPHELLVEQELRAKVFLITENFPPKRKMVFRLIREEGFSYRQVAQLMEISERTVEVHLKLAVKALREGVEKFLHQKNAKKPVQDLIKVLLPMLWFW